MKNFSNLKQYQWIYIVHVDEMKNFYQMKKICQMKNFCQLNSYFSFESSKKMYIIENIKTTQFLWMKKMKFTIIVIK